MDTDPPTPRLPDVSHLQFLALSVLARGPSSGQNLREAVRSFGVRRTRAAFYQFMSRLERDGLATGDYEQTSLGGRLVTERRYAITPAGARALASVRAFHAAVERGPVPGPADA